MTTEEVSARPGSGADLSRRMDAIERSHEALARDFASLAGTVARVELNQTHAEDLNKLRFSSLDTAVGTIAADLKGFMGRIESLISGEVQLPAQRDLMRDWTEWREHVDETLPIIYTKEQRRDIENRLDSLDEFKTQARLLGRLMVILIGGNALAVIVAIGGIALAVSK